MYRSRFITMLVVCLAVAGMAGATARTKKKTSITLVSAYTRVISESEQSNPPMQGTFIVLKWNYATYPESVFWRGEGGWLTCSIERARKTTVNGDVRYMSEDIAIDKIKKGDTLMLTPITGGRFPIPEGIPENAKNTLFYQTGGNAMWRSFPVTKITKK